MKWIVATFSLYHLNGLIKSLLLEIDIFEYPKIVYELFSTYLLSSFFIKNLTKQRYGCFDFQKQHVYTFFTVFLLKSLIIWIKWCIISVNNFGNNFHQIIKPCRLFFNISVMYNRFCVVNNSTIRSSFVL